MRHVRTYIMWFLALAAVCPIWVGTAQAGDEELPSIALIADSSLTLPMSEIIRAYSTKTHKAVAASFQPVAEQELDTADGANYDVLITARSKLIDALKQRGLVDIYSEAVIAENHLVLVAARASNVHFVLGERFPLAEMIQYFSWQPGLVIGNPETLLEGSVAREMLRQYQVLEDLEPYTIYEKEVPEIMRLVREEKKLAFVWESDAKQYADVDIIARAPAAMQPATQYVAVVLAGEKMGDARQFVDFVKQVQSQKTLETYGHWVP